MGGTVKIRIRKPTQTGVLLWILLILPFGFGCLHELLGLPWAIRYLMDAAWCLLVIYLGLAKRWSVQLTDLWILAFFAYVLIRYLPQWQSPLYFLWGVRNNFRFYVAFSAFAVFLSRKDVEKIFKVLDKLFWIDIAVVAVQFFVLNLRGDHLSGLFGIKTGGNGYTNIFFLIIICKSIVFCLDRQEKIILCLTKCLAALTVAAMAELKFFFVEFVIVVLLGILFSDFSWRKVAILMGSAVGVWLGVVLLSELFPGFDGWFSWQWFLEMATADRGYTSTGDLNRLNAISKINGLWLVDGWQRCFGLGLGNCDTSSFALVNTPFYETNAKMHYTWISYAMMYLETGWIGLTFFFGFFVLVFVGIGRCEKSCNKNDRPYGRIGRILAILCPIFAVYNSSLRMESGYMVYFVLAVPFALRRCAGVQVTKRERKR